MRLSFHNPSRSFDAATNRVRFWGYDHVIEVSFTVEEGVLEKLCPGMLHVEAGYLEAFDCARSRVHEVADKVYVRSAHGSFSFRLTAKDF